MTKMDLKQTGFAYSAYGPFAKNKERIEKMFMFMLIYSWNVLRKKLQKSNQKEFRIEKVTKKHMMSYLLIEKVMTFYLIVGLIKKILNENLLYKMSQCFPKPC